jgi:hypothetical protein
MKTEDIVRSVLDEYVGLQLNIDSETARDHLAKHIASEIEFPDQQKSSDYTDTDLSI